ncbi:MULTISPECIES: helix-turn-helix transcriptional regulator [unclassified Sphingomonas]|uniref:helix-turn-helix transcriptional regulator n=1 Tax=unclassified Sphingomonas TaxID=196159 RepID=UPI0022B2D5E0|nr:helix-turn-helix transcriptional regulator [Sphingomonas sp. NIBR02145]WHU02919.1 helix-turn-helix transcriptional regulator [Sphingomonas sp. NIBR02145]
MASQPVRVHRYTTAQIDAKDRHEVWLSHWPGMTPLYHTEPLEQFRISSSIAQLGEIALVFTDISAQRWRRDKRLVDMGNDSMALTVNLDGKAAGVVGKQAQDWVQMPGSAVIVDRQQTSIHDSAGGRSISLSVPRHLAIEAGLDVASLHGTVLNPAEIAMFTSHAMQIREALPRFSEEDAPRLGKSMLDVLVLALKGASRTEAPGFREDPATLVLRARNEVQAHLGSPSLTVNNLCRKLGVSRSTLHRLFEAGGGVQAYIRDMRLEAARQALLNPENLERIGDLAERLGFSDAAHLSRLFKARFGETPSDCRARAALTR